MGTPADPSIANRRCDGIKASARSDDELPAGRAADGQLVSIDKAKAAGLACELVCPACGGQLIAYLNTTKKRQHFGHQSRGECRFGYETAIHLYAKQLIERHAKLTLPAVKAASGKVLRVGQEIAFDSVLVEQRFHEIIPDITAIKKERRLLVEIAVTHPCELRKLQVLAQREVAAVEIDLSAHRLSTKPQALDDAILQTAPRKWVYHPAIAKEDRDADARQQEKIARLRAEAEARVAAERKQSDDAAIRLVRQFEGWKRETAIRQGGPATEIPYYFDLELCGLEDLVDIEVPGQWVLASSPKRWQSEVLWQLLTRPQLRSRPLDGATVGSLLERMHYLRPELQRLDAGVNAALRRIDPRMPSVLTVGQAYVDALRDAHVLDETGRLSAEILEGALARRQAALDARRAAANAERVRKEQEAREAIQAEGRRQEDGRRAASRTRIDEELDRLLQRLPVEDREGFDRANWWLTPLADGYTPERRVELERFGNLLADEIAALAHLVETSGPPAQNLLNLPLRAMREQRDREAAERAAQQELEYSSRRLAAIEQCGASEQWLETPMLDLEGLTPRLAALKSYDLYQRARDLLFPKPRREPDFGLGYPFATPNPEPFRQRLSAAAKYCYGARAPLWLNTTHRMLGGVPSQMCQCTRSLERCLDQLEADYRKKLPARLREA